MLTYNTNSNTGPVCGGRAVLDIVLLMAFIMVTDTPEAEEFALADMNVDGTLNVLDVVILVDIVLGS